MEELLGAHHERADGEGVRHARPLGEDARRRARQHRRRRSATTPAARSGGATPSPTHVPQLRINFECDENRTIWTAGFQRLLHGALVRGGGPTPRPDGWVPNRGVGESFYIQARGSKSYGGVSHWIWHADKPPEPAHSKAASRRHGGAGLMP